MGKYEYIAIEPDSQGYVAYSSDDDQMWHTLMQRQMGLVQNRACEIFLQGLSRLNFPENSVPQCKDISNVLQQRTGWEVVPVESVIGFGEFFGLLADKKFPAATFIRNIHEMEYLQEPDIFHEFFGHIPPLTDPDFANFVHAYGKYALTVDPGYYGMLARLFWFSVEFGLVKTASGVRALGAGILSSPKEVAYAIDGNEALYKPFDLVEVFRTRYRIDILQPTYFVFESLEQIYDLPNQDLVSAIDKARQMGMYEAPQPTVDEDQVVAC